MLESMLIYFLTRMLKQVDAFTHQSFIINAKGGCEKDVKNRIKAAWGKWTNVS